MLRVFMPYLDGAKNVLVLPIPMTEKRMRKRGYNQAEDLADAFLGLLAQVGVPAEGYNDILIKRRETLQQKHLSLRERKRNLQGVFHLAHRAILKDKTVLLIDDIMTTGTTGDACARLCKGAGAKAVYFITVASLPERLP
jgi:ComF family protein